MGAAVARLKRRADFLKVAGARKKWVAPGLIVQARVRDSGAREGNVEVDPALVRVGFTVSRKVGNAVARNRARRRLRAAAAAVFTRRGFDDHVKKGVDLVVIGRTDTLTRSFPDLIGDLTLALERLEVWRSGETGKTTKRIAKT